MLANGWAGRRLILAGLVAGGLLIVSGCSLESPPAGQSAPATSAKKDAGGTVEQHVASDDGQGSTASEDNGGNQTNSETAVREEMAADGKVSPSPSRPELTAAGVKPATDDTLLFSYPDDPDTLNVVTSHDTTSQEFQSDVYEPLASQNPANPDEFEPKLAESWEFDPEKLEFTIHLRKGVKWHPMSLPSGKPLPTK
ncbi:MAG TPA: hypothetical protein VMF30_02220, partial [Pirellulales bacterium]|nr:hypothetical protein [Pirellulales bacterium]